MDLLRGPEAIKISVALYRTAFPDVQIAVEKVIADGDTVVLCWTARHARAGERTGSGATGRQGSLTGITRSRHAGAKIVESWTYWDRLGVLGQLTTMQR